MLGAFITILTFLLLAQSDASNSCSYIYKVPRTSGSICDAKGGIDADLLDRVWSLKGGVQGIKLIGKANMDVLKNFQTQMRQIQQQYGQYSNVLNNLKKQIDDLKMILNAVPDEPGIDEVDDSPRVPRAADPNKAIKAALSMAEWKLINATMVLENTMKKREQLEMRLEKSIKDQKAKVQTILSKIANIESSLSSIPAAAPMVGKPLSNAVQQEITNLTSKVISLIVDVNVLMKISGNKAADVKSKLDNTTVPLSTEAKTLKDLKNITNSMNSTFSRIDADVQDLMNTVVNATQQIDPLYQQLRADENAMFNKYNKVVSDYNSVNSRVSKEEADLITQKADLAAVNYTLSDLSQGYTFMKNVYDAYNKSYTALSQFPALRMGSLDYYAHQALKKQNATYMQLVKMVNVIKMQIKGLQTTLSPSG